MEALEVLKTITCTVVLEIRRRRSPIYSACVESLTMDLCGVLETHMSLIKQSVKNREQPRFFKKFCFESTLLFCFLGHQ